MKNSFTQHLLVLFLLFSNSLAAQTWTGATSTDWNTATNWTSPASVPTAASNVTIPATVVSNRWPVLATDITLNTLTSNAATSQLNVNGKTITAGSINCYGIINNTAPGTDIRITLTGGGTSYMRNMVFNDHVFITINGTGILYDNFGGGTNNTYNGNMNYTINGSGAFYAGYYGANNYNGNFTLNRTVIGHTEIFYGGANITGNASITTIGGALQIGTTSVKTAVGGTINVMATGVASGIFYMARLINQTAGGTITINGKTSVNFSNDTIKANLKISGHTTGFDLLNSHITGNINYADSTSNGSTHYVRSNVINGTTVYVKNGNGVFYDNFGGNTTNTYNGNVTYTFNSTGATYISYYGPNTYNGNLVLTRPTAGTTDLFNNGANISGNLTLTTVGGSFHIGNDGFKTTVGGMVNVHATGVASGDFTLRRVINQTAGGLVNVNGKTSVDLSRDTLKANIIISGHTTALDIINNHITGNLQWGDTIPNGSTHYVRSNWIIGTSTFVKKGNGTFYDSYSTNSNNHYAGNVSYTAPGTGAMYVSYYGSNTYTGNVTLNRTGIGTTSFFNNGSTISGNLSLSTVGGAFEIGNDGFKTAVGGTININATGVASGAFYLRRVINQTAGGLVNVNGKTSVDLSRDTLKANISISGHTTGLDIINNHITGNLQWADSLSNGSTHFIRSNHIIGTTSYHKKGSGTYFDNYSGGTANNYMGDVTYTVPGTGTVYVSYYGANTYSGNVTLNRTGIGTTTFFNNGATIGGNLSLNSAGGSFEIGHNSFKTQIAGMVNVVGSGAGAFYMRRLINQMAGGNITINDKTSVEIERDTILANISIMGHTTGFEFNYNHITGNIQYADHVTNGSGKFIRGSIITGNSAYVMNGNGTFYDTYSGNTQNRYMGDVSYTRNGSGAVYVGYYDTVSVGGNLTFDIAAGGGAVDNRYIKFIGSAPSVLEQLNNRPLEFEILTMAKTSNGDLTLEDSLRINTRTRFSSGIIHTSANKELIFTDNAQSIDANDLSHVNGPVKKIGNDAFSFPVGNGQAKQSIAISAPSSTVHAFRAQYFFQSPHPTYDTSAAKRGALANISGVQYWMLDPTIGNSSVLVTLDIGKPGGVALTNIIGNMRVARWTGTAWQDLGNGENTGDLISGTVRTTAATSNYGVFNLAATTYLDGISNIPVALTTPCTNQPLTVNVTASGVFNPLNVFTAQLSNAAGSFASPLNIGTLTASPSGMSQNLVINAWLPNNLNINGNGYRVRVISSHPHHLGKPNGSPIVLNSLYMGADTLAPLECPGDSRSLLTVYNLTGLTPSWSTGTPASVMAGQYELRVQNANLCKDTVQITVAAEVFTWTGASNTNWHNAANWSNGKVPHSLAHVIVPTGTPQCIISDANVAVQSVQAKGTANLRTQNNRTLTIAGTCMSLPVN